LAACLRTRDAAELATPKLQLDNAGLAAEVAAAQRARSLANDISLRRIAECEAKANETMVDSAASEMKLQKSVTSLQSQYGQIQESMTKTDSENAVLQKKLKEMQKEHERKMQDIKNNGEHTLAALKNQDAKVMEAHRVLQKAHEVLVKRHKELQEQTVKDSIKNATETKRLTLEYQTCTKELATAKQTEAQMQQKQEELKAAAMKKGADENAAQFQGAVKNMTATKQVLEAKIKEGEAVLAEKVKMAQEATKDMPDMELKLRRCRQSREKTELDFQRVLKRCPQKGVFLQQWP